MCIRDRALFVVDAALGWTRCHDELIDLAPARRIVVWNKVDLAPTAAGPPALPLEDALVVPTCAVDQRGIGRLLDAIAQTLVPEEPSEGTAIPFRVRHVELLQQALQAIEQDQPSFARALLQAMF